MRRQVFSLALVSVFAAGGAASSAGRPNVLFIAVDDLRPQLGCYGDLRVQSPNIDRLAAGGVVFERAYCMVPVCGASRASLMTGVRPSRNRFVTYTARADEEAPGVAALHAHLRSHGYHTVSLGKVLHVREDSAAGWSEPPWRPRGAPTYRDPDNVELARRRERKSTAKTRVRGPPYEAADVADDEYADGRIAERAVADLRRLAALKRPFFLAVGFLKPHLPFVAPKRYWDLYRREDLALPANYRPPEGAPEAALHQWGELRAYAGVPAKGPLPADLALTLIHGYHACVSYTDAQIGRVLDELERLGIAGETIVVLWGDHGWNLGEHGLWCKHCCFETSMRAPLIVRAPGIAGGVRTRELTEFIDIYPTLCELIGIPLPAHLDGRSFLPLLDDPAQPWKEAAIGRYVRGDTVRTDRWRYTEYATPRGEPLGRMLYDHRNDPAEDVNVLERPENRDTVVRLARRLHDGMGRDWPAARGRRPRLIVTTDIGGDPDDTQSLVRLLLFANELEIEGLIASASGAPGEVGRDVVRRDLIREVVEAYGRVRGNLALHAPGYPTAEELLARIKEGNPRRGVGEVGPGKDTEGSRWIIEVADRADPRPVHIAIWGGSTDLAQALWRVREDRVEEGLAAFSRKLRVHAIGHQDATGPWILENFPDLFYVLSKAPDGEDKRESVYRGMYLGGDESLTSREWIDEHVREGHGPLGALYPPRTWTAPNPHAALKEGDTPSWFFVLENGLQDAAHPEWGGWGGRFERAAGDGAWRDARDRVGDVTHARATVWRWRPAFQRDFAARMDWCVRPRAEANHHPAAVLDGDRSRRILERVAGPGEAIALSAAGSSDRDGDRLAFRWWVYREAGTFGGDVTLDGAESATATVRVPRDAAGKTIHVILEVTDDGEPPLVSFRRAVIAVAEP